MQAGRHRWTDRLTVVRKKIDGKTDRQAQTDRRQVNHNSLVMMVCFRVHIFTELLYEDVFVVWEIIWAARHLASEHFVLFIALALLQFYR